MTTLEVQEALDAVAKAERCVLDCNRDLTSARRVRDQALQRQRELENERIRLDLALRPGQHRFTARGARPMNEPETRAAEDRIRELDAILAGGPERRAGRLY